MSQYPIFPSSGSIPPACFYQMSGLTEWLNRNPTYKQYFINYPRYYPYLYSNSTISELVSSADGSFSSIYSGYKGYNIENVKLSPLVTTLSQHQSMKYREQLELFRRVYTFNSNAYLNSLDNGPPPIYFRFQSAMELMDYRGSVALVSKLYPFDAMANGTNENGSTLGWIVPFPL